MNLQGTESGYWTKHDNHYRYTLHDCDLHRFTHKDAKQCLAQRHLVLIGDSIVRLQYLSLIHFIIYGEYPAPYGNDSKDGQANVAQHKAYKTWEETMVGLSNTLFKGYETCDCYRDGVWRNIKNISENRYFKMSDTATDSTLSTNSNEKDNNKSATNDNFIKVSYFFDTCMGRVFGHYPFSPPTSRPWVYQKPDWKGEWKDLPAQWKADHQNLEADAVFTSCGHWPFLAGSGTDGWTQKSISTVADTMTAFQSMLKTNPTRPFPISATTTNPSPPIIWRTNFPSQQVFKRKGKIEKIQNNMKAYDTALKVANERKFRVIDTNAMVQQLNHSELPPMKYSLDKSNPCPMIKGSARKPGGGGQAYTIMEEALWHNGDGTHPCPWMSEEINNFLLNVLCF